MAYDGDKTWRDVSTTAEQYARAISRLLNEGLEAYMNWQTYRAGRDDAAIAAALNRTEAEITDLDSCFAAFKEIHDFADNVASPVQGDRFYSMRLFS